MPLRGAARSYTLSMDPESRGGTGMRSYYELRLRAFQMKHSYPKIHV